MADSGAEREDQTGMSESTREPARESVGEWSEVSSGGTYTVRGLVALLLRRRRFVGLTLGGLLALCVVYCLIAPNQYEAKGTVALAMQSSPSVSLAAAEAIAPASILSTPLQLETIVNVLRSERLAWRVIGELKLYENPAFCPHCATKFPGLRGNGGLGAPGAEAESYLLERFDKLLHARALPRTLLIEVSFRTRSATLSAEVVNRLVADYMAEETAMRMAATAESAGWLEGQLAALTREAEGNERALAEFEQQHGILTSEQTLANGESVEIARDPEEQQVEDLGRQLAAATGDRIVREAMYREAQQGDPEQVLAANPELAAAMGAGGATLALGLETRRSELAVEMAQWRAEHGPKFPQVVELQKSLDSIDAQIKAANTSLLEGFRRMSQEATDREKLLRGEWQAASDRSVQRNSVTLQDAVLRARVLAGRELITRLDAKIREARLNAGAHGASITVVDPARAPFKPVAPDLPLYLAITLVCGGWLAVGGALFLDALSPAARSKAAALLVLGCLLGASAGARGQAPLPSTSGVPTGVVPPFAQDGPPGLVPNPKTAPPIWNTAVPTDAPANAAGNPPGNAALGLPMALPIHGGDFLDVSEFHTPEFHSTVRVSGGGTVNLPMIGAVKVAGMSESEAEQVIEKALVEDGMLLHPEVKVLVTNAAGQDVSVLGEVARPGVYAYTTHHRLLDLISAASGMTPTAGRLVSIVHREDPHTAHPVVMDPSGTDTQTEHNPELEPGDTVLVSRAGLVYVIGDVVRPGGFAVDPTQGLTVVQALSLAWGATPNAVSNKAILIRNQKGGRTMTTLNLKRMIRGQDPDLPVRDQDILYVPDSATKNLLNKSLEAAIQSVIGVSLYAGLVYSQRF